MSETEIAENLLENQGESENDMMQEEEVVDETDDESVAEEEDQDDPEESTGSWYGSWDGEIDVQRLKVLLYGVSGTGKTTMAATFPSPIFLDLENGMLSTRRIGRVLRYPADPKKSVSDYMEVVDFYQKVRDAINPPFKTVVIDSLNELQMLLTQYVVKKFTGVKRQYNDQLTLADYGKANRDFAKVIRAFLNLPYHIVFIAGCAQREAGEEDVQLAPKFVGKQVGPDTQRMMDMIGYCHAKKMPDGKSEHYVSFHITPQYLAKDRLGIVKRDIPNNFDALISSTGAK